MTKTRDTQKRGEKRDAIVQSSTERVFPENDLSKLTVRSVGKKF